MNRLTPYANRAAWHTCIAIALALAFTPLLHATPTITISDGKKKDTVTVSNASGLISFNGKVGKFTLSLSTTAASGLDMMPSLILSSLSYGAKKAGTLTISLSDTSVHPNDGSILSTINGQTSGKISYSTFADTGNSLFGKGTMLSTHGGLTGSAFSAAGSAILSSQTPFSLTEVFVLSQSKGGHTGFTATVVDPPTGPATVPDTGSTLMLMGIGLGSIGFLRRKIC
jgi:hypothetical protein